MNCNYTFKTKDGEVTINGMAAMKAFLALNGVQSIEGAQDLAPSMSRRAQAETPEFKRWFGDSVVTHNGKTIDKGGRPLVVYHGASGDFSVFDGSLSDSQARTGAPKNSFFFSSSPEIASSYTVAWQGDFSAEYVDDANVMPVHLSISNPLKVDAKGENWRDIQFKGRFYDINELAARAQREGYDGLIVKRVQDRGRGDAENDIATTYVAFRPEQIKSATGNSGAFDPENPDIRYSNRAQGEGWRDAAGRLQFKPGAMAYRFVADIANNLLDKLYLKPIDKDLSRAMRKMKAEVENAREMTAGVATKLGELSEDERNLISDVIEGELKRGVKPPQRVLEIAASMQEIMSEQTAEMVRLGMLSEDAAGRWDGKYLPRFYESKLMDEAKQWAKAAKALLARVKTMQGVKGSSLKGRGIFETIPVDELEAWLAEGWEERDPNFDPATDSEIVVWRDYTRAERESMGEIRDSMFRFVMGYMRSQKDIALGRLYENLADTIASKSEKEGYVQVPRTNVEDTKARRYGKLAGKWVPKEVMDHLSANDASMDGEIVKMYRKALSMWKEGKTVLNPVAHANNIMGNLTMAHFAGVSYWDAHKYIGTVRDLVKGGGMVDEARKAGLFGGTVSQAELVSMLPDQLKVLAAKTESKAAKGVDTVWSAMSLFLRKPLGIAYEAEDLFFRYLIYRDARGRGMEVDDAVEYSQQFIFTYDDLPKGARIIRDAPVGIPFFSWTYKAIPVITHTAAAYPWRFAAPAAAMYAVNAGMYAIAASMGGGDDEPWWESITRYVTDPEFRAKVKEMEKQERKNLPEWQKGTSALGTPKAIRLGQDDLTNLPVFLDVSRIFPGGDLGDLTNNAGGVPLPAWLTPNNPVLTTMTAFLQNKDAFTGKEIVSPKLDTGGEKAGKWGEYAWRQFAPAIAPFNYHFDRTMNAVANGTDQIIDLGIKEYTGVDKMGQPVQPKYAVMQTVGIKARPVDLEVSEQIQNSQRKQAVSEMDKQIRTIRRLESKGFYSSDKAETLSERLREKRQNLREGLTVGGDEKE